MNSESKEVTLIIRKVISAVDRICVKQMVIDGQGNTGVVNEFFEVALGYQPYYSMMPTRMDSFLSTIHENQKLRDFVLDMVEAVVFNLSVSQAIESPYKRLSEYIAETMLTTKNKRLMAPDHFKAAINLPNFNDTLPLTPSNPLSQKKILAGVLAENPLLITFYVVSQFITELTTFNTLYLKNLTEGK